MVSSASAFVGVQLVVAFLNLLGYIAHYSQTFNYLSKIGFSFSCFFSGNFQFITWFLLFTRDITTKLLLIEIGFSIQIRSHYSITVEIQDGHAKCPVARGRLCTEKYPHASLPRDDILYPRLRTL